MDRRGNLPDDQEATLQRELRRLMTVMACQSASDAAIAAARERATRDAEDVARRFAELREQACALAFGPRESASDE
jgi:hypothetical protein